MVKILLSSIAIAFLLTAGVVGYVLPCAVDQKNVDTQYEVLYARVTGFGATKTYSMNKVTGDETFLKKQLVPGMRDVYVSVERSAACSCITTVYWRENDNKFSLYATPRGYVTVVGDKTLAIIPVSLDDAKIKLDKARAVVSDIREMYAARKSN